MRCAFVLAAALLACGPPPIAALPRPPPPAIAAPAPSDLGGDAPGGEYRSERFDLRFSLPDGRGWRVTDDTTPWLVADHAASSTSLLVRTWREDGRASRAGCEARARLWRDLPRREGSLAVEERRIDVPAGFDTVVEIRVAEALPGARGASGAMVDGFALAFGGRSRRCFAFVAVTRASGPGAEVLVARRLAAVVEVSLGGLTLESELAPRPPAMRDPVP